MNQINKKTKIELLDYVNLRKHFNKVVDNILGKNYYNWGDTIIESDYITCNDIIKQANKTWLERLFNW